MLSKAKTRPITKRLAPVISKRIIKIEWLDALICRCEGNYEKQNNNNIFRRSRPALFCEYNSNINTSWRGQQNGAPHHQRFDFARNCLLPFNNSYKGFNKSHRTKVSITFSREHHKKTHGIDLRISCCLYSLKDSAGFIRDDLVNVMKKVTKYDVLQKVGSI